MIENIIVAMLMMIVSGLISSLIILIVCKNDIKWIKEIIDNLDNRVTNLENNKNVAKIKNYC